MKEELAVEFTREPGEEKGSIVVGKGPVGKE